MVDVIGEGNTLEEMLQNVDRGKLDPLINEKKKISF